MRGSMWGGNLLVFQRAGGRAGAGRARRSMRLSRLSEACRRHSVSSAKRL